MTSHRLRSFRAPLVLLALVGLPSLVAANTPADFSGHWEGKLNLPGQELKFDIDFEREDGQWVGDISIPAQHTVDHALGDIKIDGSRIRFVLPGIPGDPTFDGTLSGDVISGDFSQASQSTTFEMTRGVDRAAAAQEVLEGYDAFVEQALADWKVPGFAIGIVVDDELVFARGFGYRDVDNKLPVTPKTLFAIGSCTKAFTTFALGTLVDEGIVDWDKPVIDYLPDFRMHDPEVTMRLTVRDLVTHRSGLPRHDLVWYNSPESREALVRRIRYLPLSKGLREEFQYNNLMFMTAGYLTGRLTSGTWEDAVRYRIFKKLDMNGSNFSVHESQNTADYALPYEEKDDEIRRVNFRDISNVGPAGSINSNLEDMSRWIRVHLNDGKFNGERIIENSTLKDLHTPHMAIANLPTETAFSPPSYALGWGVATYHGHLRVAHGGGIDGFITHVAVYPNDRVGVVAFMNTTGSSFPSLMARHAIDRVLDLPRRDWSGEALKKRAERKETRDEAEDKKDMDRKPDTKPAHDIGEYAGEYEHPGYGIFKVAVSGDGLSLTYNNITSPFGHWHYEVFNGMDNPDDHTFEDIKIRFLTNMNGDVDGVAVVLERAVDELVFARKADKRMSDPAYLARFVGEYELTGRITTIRLKGNTLTAFVPGQPTYDLEPDRDDRFNLKGLNGFSVEFLTNDDGEMIARFHQPNGVFEMSRRRPQLLAPGKNDSEQPRLLED